MKDNLNHLRFQHRYWSKMVEHAYDAVGSLDGTERINEIKDIDVNLLSNEERAILYCVISTQNSGLFNLSNLKNLLMTQPLATSLRLVDFKNISLVPAYRQMNIVW